MTGMTAPGIATLAPMLSAVGPQWSETGTTARPGQPPQELAQEFEGVFLSMLLKQMRQSSGPEGGLFPGDDSDTYGGMFDMFLGQHIAKSGGVGLADSIAASISRQQSPES